MKKVSAPKRKTPARTAKREPSDAAGARIEGDGDETEPASPPQSEMERQLLRSKYLQVINKISDVRDDIANVDSDKFNIIINEVENLHQFVTKPREQVADASALLDITNTLVTSVKSQSNRGISLAHFVTCLIKDFGKSTSMQLSEENDVVSIDWQDIGLQVCPTFKFCKGVCTMIGPMNTEPKIRKVIHRKCSVRPTQTARPEELGDAGADEKTDTDKNMAMMFGILRRKKRVKLENLVLNRNSFAQTVDNLFAMSFLIKDGRAEISVDESGSHFVSPKNAPDAESVMSGEAAYRHFVFRFDFKDWKIMADIVPLCEEVMPHREVLLDAVASQTQPDSSQQPPTKPTRKSSRKAGPTADEDTIVEDSSGTTDYASLGLGNRRSKRKLNWETASERKPSSTILDSVKSKL